MTFYLALAAVFFFSITGAVASQKAIVITEGAAVYRKASFDAKVIGSFRAGTRVDISNKVFGPFYRIRFKQGVLGYVADTDVMPDGKKPAPAKDEFTETTKPKKKPPSVPIARKISIGPAVGMVVFREFIGKTEQSQSLSAFGIKASFPTPFIQGPFQSELSFFGHPGVPDYYRQYTTGGTASGGIWLIDWTLDYAIDQGESDVLYLGSGPLISWTQLQAEVAGKQLDLSEMKAGAVFAFGYATWFGSFCVRGEVKYYIEETSFFGGSLGFQFDLN